MASPLRLLANLIVKAVDDIEQSCLHRGCKFPDLNEPFTPEADEARNDPIVEHASIIIAASAFQLLQSVRSPHGAITLASFSVSIGVLERKVSVLSFTVLSTFGLESCQRTECSRAAQRSRPTGEAQLLL